MTLKEIAREAGVSISTVSRVINKNSTNVASKEVQDRIWEIVRRTGYTPNATARSLKTGAAKAADSPPAPLPAFTPGLKIPTRTCFSPRWHAASKRKPSNTTTC